MMMIGGTGLGQSQRAQRRAGGGQSQGGVVVERATMVPEGAQRQVSHTLDTVVDLVQLLQILLWRREEGGDRFRYQRISLEGALAR